MPKVLLISFTDHGRDPRLHRQIQALSGEPLELFTAGTGAAPEMAGRHTLLTKKPPSLARQLLWAIWAKAGMYERFYWDKYVVSDAWLKLRGREYDLIVANDLETLPLALRLAAGKGKVWVDAHEYTPRQHEDHWAFRFFLMPFWEHVCHRYLPQADYMTTVGNRLSEEYQARYGVASDVLINAPAFEGLQPTPTDPDHIRCIHHGGVNSMRRLDLMVDMMKYLDQRFQLDLMLIDNDKQGMKSIRNAARGLRNVRFLEPVPMPEIARRIHEYDMGLCFIWPQNFNYRHSLPNKFFEFIQARLAVVIWPSPEMQRIVEEHGTGVVVESYDPAEMAARLNELTAEDISRFKAAASHCADVYNAEQTMNAIREAVARLLQVPKVKGA